MAQQYQTVQIPKRLELFTSIGARGYSFDTDSYLSNAFLEKDPNDGQMWVRKRPGFGPERGGAGLGGAGGLYTFNASAPVGNPVILSIVNTGVYKNVAGTVLIGAMGLTPQHVRFETVNYLGGRVAIISGTNGVIYYTDGVTLTGVADPNLPLVRVVGLAYLDDTLYIMTPNGDIRGSGIADPTTWNPLNTIAARDEGDFGVGIAKHMSYIVALKQWSIQFFYDAGNASGSPLSRLPGSKLSFGCMHGATVRDIDGELFFVANSRVTSPFVVKLINLRPQVISNEAVNRLLFLGAPTNTGGPDAQWRSFVLMVAGHKFYVLTSIRADFTLAYDVQYNVWYRWTSPTGGAWTPVDSAFDPAPGGNLPPDIIVQDSVTERLHICNVAEASYNSQNSRIVGDNGAVFPVDIYTQNYDMGTIRNKQLSGMFFVADQLPTSVSLRFSDDDRQTWSSFRDINFDVTIPNLTDAGTFRKRAWNLRHFAPEAFRIKSSDLQMDIGAL